MRRSITTAFPTAPAVNTPPIATSGGIACLQDTPTLTLDQPQHSLGATAVIKNPMQGPAVGQHWSVLAVSIAAYLGFTHGGLLASNTTNQPFGEFGRILCGLDPTGSEWAGYVAGNNMQPWSVAMRNLPPDPALLAPLWDPATDKMPPWAPFAYGVAGYAPAPPPAQLLPVYSTILPPVPIDLNDGVQPAVGIWATPSLLGISNTPVAGWGYTGLTLFYGTCTIDYDDGL